MECPASKELAELLAASPTSATAEPLWRHLEICPHCRAELDRISDDAELQQWRGKTASENIDINEVFALKQLVDQWVDQDTVTSSPAEKTTNDDHGVDRRILESFDPSEDPNELGKLGQYRIKRMLGHGGMAVVFEAIDTELDRVVALKILRTSHSDNPSRERFIREARALAGVKNPNVISIYSVQSNEAQQPLIAMEMADGGSLQETLRVQQNRLQQNVEPKLAATWTAMVADGLAAVHESGLIHRDIKPSNVLLSTSGGKTIAKLADFGLARFATLENRDTQSGVLLGTPAYMSPEHVSTPESCNSRSDIYSLGVTLYEMLTSDVPFRGAVHTVLQRIGRDEPTAPRSLNALIPRDLETVCMKAMHREPMRRYSTAKEFADDLRRWIDGQPILARPATSLEQFMSWCRRNKRVATLAGAVACLLVVLAGVSTYFALTIQAADQNLKREKGTVEATSQQLQIALEDAKNQRQIAIESLNDLVTKVQAELKQRSGTFKLRESILDVAVKGLDQITQVTESSDIDLTRVLAHIQKGDIYDSLGKSDASIAELEKGTALAEAYNKQSPDQPDVQKVLGDALFAQADLAMRRGAMDIALPLYQRVLPIREAALASLTNANEDANEDAKTFHARKALCMVLGRIGDVYDHSAAWDESFSFQIRSLQLAKTNALHFPESPIAKRDLSLTNQRMGSLELLRNHNDAASEHFLQAVELNRSLQISDPGNKQYAGDLGYILGELSKLTNAKGDKETALAQAKESILQCEKVVAADPEDTDAKIKAAMSWLQLYWIFLVENKLPMAEKAIEKFLQLNANLVEQNPTASKFPSLSAAWLDKLADLQARQGKIAEVLESNRRLIKYVELCQKAADARPEIYQPIIVLREKLETGVRLFLDGKDMSDDTISDDSEVLYLGRLFAMYEAARTGKTDVAIELGQKLTASKTVNPIISSAAKMIVARSYSMCFGELSKKNASNPIASAEKKEMVLEKAIEQMKSLFASPEMIPNPSARTFFLQDLDFQATRAQPSFESLSK